MSGANRLLFNQTIQKMPRRSFERIVAEAWRELKAAFAYPTPPRA